jgi:5'-nucleotidase
MAESSGEDAPRRNPLPAPLVSNLQSVLAARRPVPAEDAGTATTTAPAEAEAPDATAGDRGTPARSIVLLTCAEGIRSAGLAALVDALVAGGRCDVHVCAAESYALQSHRTRFILALLSRSRSIRIVGWIRRELVGTN